MLGKHMLRPATVRYPHATYRVQLHAGFTFDDLAGRVPYLHALGVSDCYCSPIFQATPGSKHGYDVCDYTQINRELGGEAALLRLSAALRRHDMGLLLDFVPNHMGIEGPFNHWWRDVLEQGQRSRYASFFDIDWNTRITTGGEAASPATPQVLLPLLPDHYGRLLQDGKLKLVRDGGTLALGGESSRFPLRPATYAEILRECRNPDLAEIAGSFARLEDENEGTPASKKTERFASLKNELAALLTGHTAASEQLDAVIARLNGTPGDPASFDLLDNLIGDQHYRLARWQAGAHGVNYRRFFAINTLVGLRMEDEAVFEETHALLGRLLREGIVTGLRIDHIDGLRDPQTYLDRLQTLAAAGRAENAHAPYVVVEKILAREEHLPASWVADGTTGYEFIPQLAGLFTAPENEAAFDAVYKKFTGAAADYEPTVRAKKKLIIGELFANTVLTLAQGLHDLIQVDRRWRDLTVPELSAAISELIAGLGVYRTYRRPGEPIRPEDHAEIMLAGVVAIRENTRIEPLLVAFVTSVLLGDYPEAGAPDDYRAALDEWVLTFQQYTGAVMAKSVEDTAYYTCNRLIALNEVGGQPDVFGADVRSFHEANLERRERTPHALLTTSTHDTKVSEDVRARLYALSEIPAEWAGWVRDWRQLNERHKTEVDGRLAPDADEEYRLYQTLLGAWPLAATTSATDAPGEKFRQRIRGYFEKAVNEAKVNTTDAHPNPEWIDACLRFADAILTPGAGNVFPARFAPAALRVAQLARINSLAQTVLKLTVPGIPDIYQGNESWDFSLVDPDNRRDVDFDELEKLATTARNDPVKTLFENWTTGAIKLALTRALLGLRRDHPRLFLEGDYTPLEVRGEHAQQVVAFFRSEGTARLLVLVPRLVAKLPWPQTGDVWKDTFVETGDSAGTWENVLDGGRITSAETGELLLATLFANVPVAVLLR